MRDPAKDGPTGVSEIEVGNVSIRLQELGLNAPTGICILPSNYINAASSNDLFVPQTAPDLRVLLRKAGVNLTKIEPDGVKVPYRDDRDRTLILPMLFFAASYFTQDPNQLNVALGVVANFVTDFFRGMIGTHRVNCSVVVEKTDKKTTKMIHYNGPPEEFGKLIDCIKKTLN